MRDLLAYFAGLYGAYADATRPVWPVDDLLRTVGLADRILLLLGGRIVADGSPDTLRLQVSRTSDVRWSSGGHSHVHSTDDPVGFVRGLLTKPGDVADLEVRRHDLEDVYLELVRSWETHGAVPDLAPAAPQTTTRRASAGGVASPDIPPCASHRPPEEP